MGFVSSKGDSVSGQSSQELAPVVGKKTQKKPGSQENQKGSLRSAPASGVLGAGGPAICPSTLSEQLAGLQPNTLTFHLFCNFAIL